MEFFSNTENTCKKINIRDFLDKYMTGAVIPTDIFIALQEKLLSGERYASLNKNIVDNIESKWELRQREASIERECTRLNNLGIEQEKIGNIENAIYAYEKSISLGVPYCHPFDRLMILYRKRKEYDNEISIINKAADILCKRYPDLKQKYSKRLEKAKLLKLRAQ